MYNYGGGTSNMWWQQNQKLLTHDSLRIWNIPVNESAALAALHSKQMDLQCTIQDGDIWFSNADHNIAINLERRH